MSRVYDMIYCGICDGMLIDMMPSSQQLQTSQRRFKAQTDEERLIPHRHGYVRVPALDVARDF